MRLSLRGKNIIRNQLLVSKLWYIGKFMLFENIKNEIEKRIYKFLWNKKIYNLLDTEFTSPFGGAD